MGKVNGEEEWISLGPWPWGGKDAKEWVYKADGPIIQMTINYGNDIESILFESKSCDGIVIGCSKRIGRSNSTTFEKFCIDRSKEQLLSISMTYDDLNGQVTIISLCINTNLKKYGPFASRSGAFSMSIPIEGGAIAGFHGRGGNYFNAIGIFVVHTSVSFPMDSVPIQLKGKISCEEGWISLGPWGKEDGEDWAYKANGPIMQITIGYSNDIELIKFESKSNDGDVIGRPTTIGYDDSYVTETFCIDSTVEQLSSISLRYTELGTITSLCFHTNRNKYGPFGMISGAFVSIPIEGGVIAGFHGHGRNYLKAIGVFVAPKVDNSHSIRDPDSMSIQFAPTEHKVKVTSEGLISLGPWGNHGGVDWAYKPDGPIMEISIRYGQTINSMTFKSKSCNHMVIGSSKKIGCTRGDTTKTFEIDSSKEQLSSINLTYNTYDEQAVNVPYGASKMAITYLCFKTNRSTFGPFGSRRGASDVDIPIEGGVIVGFHGRSNRYLTAIGIFVAPKVNSSHLIQGPILSPTHFKGKISHKERWISLGPWGGEDGRDWDYKYNGPIMQICIGHGEAIDSLLFRSRSCDGLVIGSSDKIGGTGLVIGSSNKNGSTRRRTTEMFCIDSSEEQVTSIGLTWEYYNGKMRITSLCFYTNKKKYGPFGTISGDSLSIPIEGGVLAGFHGRIDTYLTAIGIFLAPKVNNLHFIQGPVPTPTQPKVLGSGVGSNVASSSATSNVASSSATTNEDVASSSATTNKDDHHGDAIPPDLVLVKLTLKEYMDHMNVQINQASEKFKQLQKLRSSEIEFDEFQKAIAKLKLQIPLTCTSNKDDHHGGGALSPTSQMILSDLTLVDMSFAEAKESMNHLNEKINQAHEKFKELQKLRRSETDSDEQKAETGKLRKAETEKLQKAIAKLKFQIRSHPNIRPADSNLNQSQRNWDNINGVEDGMMHFFHKEPEVTHTSDFDGILEDFQQLPEPLRDCLLCFFKFPPLAIIKRTPMIYLWIGQGYISQSISDVEEHADEIFDELITKGFIEPIYQKFSFEPDSCRMSCSVRSSLYEKAKLRGFTSNGTPDLDLACVLGDHSSCLINVGEAFLHCEPEIFKNMKHIKSLYLGRWQSSPTHHIELLDDKILRLIRLKRLKFLSLRGISMIKELPSFISKLNYLMILDLRACHNLEVIPKNIGLFKSLTHLDMSECYFLEHMPKSLAQLSNLQVLKGFLIGDFNNQQSCTLRDLSRLSKLRKLNIYISVKQNLILQDLENLERFEGLKKMTISWGGCSLQAQAQNITDTFQYARLPLRLQKLDLQCLPATSLPDWLMPEKLKELKKLYIRGGKLCNLGQFREPRGEMWTVEILSLKYLGELELHWGELRKIFPKLIYLHQVECPNLFSFPCDERGVWFNNEAIDIHVQLYKYLKTCGIMTSSSSMSGSGPTLAQDDSTICPVDEMQL